MEKKISKKIPEGKLINAHLNIEKEKISVKITGDFFLFPEEALLDIEEALQNLPKTISYNELNEKIKFVIKEKEIKIIGFKPEDLTEIIMEGLKSNPE